MWVRPRHFSAQDPPEAPVFKSRAKADNDLQVTYKAQ